MRVALRRQATTGSEPVFRDGGLCVDLSRRLVTVEDKEVQLTPTEYDLLRVLVDLRRQGDHPPPAAAPGVGRGL